MVSYYRKHGEKMISLRSNVFKKTNVKCILCQSYGELFFEMPPKRYYQCGHCSAIFLAPECCISKEEEKSRYQEHNNDVEDPRYQKFVEPIVLEIEQRFSRKHKGLDFGAGTGPVIAKLLREKRYSVELYDPFFCNSPEKLQNKYDFIICCEVIEHFRFPAKEFKLLKALLKPRGVLFCMTELYSEKNDFGAWYYKNDPTHVFFYQRNTLEWIKSRFGFSALKNKGRLVQFFA